MSAPATDRLGEIEALTAGLTETRLEHVAQVVHGISWAALDRRWHADK